MAVGPTNLGEQQEQETLIDPTTGFPIVPEGEKPKEETKEEGESDSVKKLLAEKQELLRRNTELANLVNVSNRMDGLEGQNRQIVQHLTQAQQQNAQGQDKWTPWLEEKLGPVLEKREQPYRQAITNLADQLDLTQTALDFPEFRNDPAVQQEVEARRRQRYQESGQVISRKDVMIYMRGEKSSSPDYIKQQAEELKKQEQQRQMNEGRQNSAFVQTGAPAAGKQPILSKPFTDLEPEEMEKFMADMRF